jgi:hypothetical protein
MAYGSILMKFYDEVKLVQYTDLFWNCVDINDSTESRRQQLFAE